MADKTFWQDLLDGPESPEERQALLDAAVEEAQTQQLERLFSGDENVMRSARQEDLEAIANGDPSAIPEIAIKAASDEIEKRARTQAMGLGEALTDPYARSRLARTALASPARAVSAIAALPSAAVTYGVGAALGNDALKGEAFDFLISDQQRINERYGISDPLNTTESIADAAAGAIVPGGLLAKAGAMAADFGVDQFIRELTDEGADPVVEEVAAPADPWMPKPEVQPYETVFDKIGVPETKPLSPLLTVPLVILAGSLGTNAISRLKSGRVIKPPKIKSIVEVDRNAPENLDTIVTSGDVLKANHLDVQQVLIDVTRRAGFPNLDDITRRVTLDTGAAATIRTRDALRTGRLDANGKSYRASTPIDSQVAAYNALDAKTRQAVSDYINLKDMLDDAEIAYNNGNQNALTTIGNHTQRIRRLEADFPIVVEFSQRYNKTMLELREFLTGDMMSPQFKQELDKTRPNYVPYYQGRIDPTDTFWARLRQADQPGGVKAEDNFLHRRDSDGNYDPRTRPDPYSVLSEYSRGVLAAELHNSTRLALIDAWRNSRYGKTTVRPVTANDTGKIEGRTIRVHRGGKEEKYVADQLLADIMKFDPYVAKHPGFFVPKRVFEASVVGPLSVTFAPVSMIRDMIAMPVTREAGTAVPNPAEVLAAIPKAQWAKTQRSVATALEASAMSGSSVIPLSMWSAQSRRAWASKLSNQYVNTFYHRAQQAGGIDASEMRNLVQVAKTKLDEATATLERNAPDLVRRFGLGPTKAMAKFVDDLYMSTMDASRLAAFEKTVKAGVDDATAAQRARNVVGDTSRSGRIYTADGKLIRGDTVNSNFANLMTSGAARAGSYIVEGVPFIVPMIQGNRRLLNAFKDDPIGTNARAWLTIGMPSAAAFAWNEMLGPEYNDYAFEKRSARDVALYSYLGLPGRPPEEGIELPLPHELSLFKVFDRGLYDFARGNDGDEISFATQMMMKSWAEQTMGIGLPTAAVVGLDIAGARTSGGLLDTLAGQGQYAIREDGVGALPENWEAAVRDQFGSVGSTVMMLAAIWADDVDDEATWNDYLDATYERYMSQVPVVKNVTGRKTPNVWFSFPAEYDRQKAAAVDEVWEAGKFFFDPRYKTEAGLTRAGTPSPFAKDDEVPDYTDAKDWVDDSYDYPYTQFKDLTMDQPTNPLYPVVFDTLMAYAKRNDIGYTGLSDRIMKYGQRVSEIRDINAGHRDAIAKFEETLQSIRDNGGDETDMEMVQFVDDFNVDLTNAVSRRKLITALENERSYLIAERLEMFNHVEEMVTEQLREAGMLLPTQRFEIEKHMKPFDRNPFGN